MSTSHASDELESFCLDEEMEPTKHCTPHTIWSYTHKDITNNYLNGSISHKIIQKDLKHASSWSSPVSKFLKKRCTPRELRVVSGICRTPQARLVPGWSCPSHATKLETMLVKTAKIRIFYRQVSQFVGASPPFWSL